MRLCICEKPPERCSRCRPTPGRGWCSLTGPERNLGRGEGREGKGREGEGDAHWHSSRIAMLPVPFQRAAPGGSAVLYSRPECAAC